MRVNGKGASIRQRGVSLVEVLVTLVIVAFGLLGVAGLLTTGLRNHHSAHARSVASMLAYDMADRMRANRQAALEGQYNTSDPSTNAIATADRNAWNTALSANLPGSSGIVTCSGSAFFTITIAWDDSKGVNGSSSQQFLFRGQL